MLNGLFVTIALSSVLLAAVSGQMNTLTDGILTSAGDAVELAIGLIGAMAFFLGLMRVAEDGGLMTSLARTVSPVMRILFPTVPSNSPAMSAMLLNISANMLGLVNAATPFGIKAMEELEKLNSRTGTATNAMVMFLAINTSALALLPSGMIALRVSLESQNPAAIFFPTWFASASATVIAITAALLLSRLSPYRVTEPPPLERKEMNEASTTNENLISQKASDSARLRVWLGRGFWLVFFTFAVHDIIARAGTESVLQLIQGLISSWSIPAIVSVFVLYGWVRRVSVYESLVEGAKQGFQVAIRIIPYLVAILVMVGMFRASGGLEILVSLIAPVTTLIGMPPEALPMAILRPLTGSGAFGVAADAMSTHGPDSLVGYMVSTYSGSTETTFYTLAVYFGAVGVRKTRHTVPACLAADVAGILAATFIVNLLLG